ncbi:MAG: hypothetical protein KDK30_07060 [Leptospiraceae bacterium]|nr:hypothetical protein [Leptospiraceae bacterium]MCB1318005.1 hypothetical protein [Leptospiraceae bacterium]
MTVRRKAHLQIIRGLMGILLCAICAGIMPRCERKAGEIPYGMKLQYKEDALKVCRAISDCLQADVRERLADEPERRDMIVRRMDRDLCVERQFEQISTDLKMIGESVTDAYTEMRPTGSEEYYRSYSRCAEVIDQAPDCASVRTAYDDDPACAILHSRPES